MADQTFNYSLTDTETNVHLWMNKLFEMGIYNVNVSITASGCCGPHGNLSFHLKNPTPVQIESVKRFVREYQESKEKDKMQQELNSLRSYAQNVQKQQEMAQLEAKFKETTIVRASLN